MSNKTMLLGLLILMGTFVVPLPSLAQQPGRQLKEALPDLRTGDVIAHTSSSNQSEWIAKGTGSPFTHVGLIVFKRDGVFVLEAVQPVKYTPLNDWIARGRGGRYTVARVRDASPEQLRAVIAEAERFLGLAYDVRFVPDDSKIYCSELVGKAFKRAMDIEVGEWRRFDDVAEEAKKDATLRRMIKKRWGRSPDDMLVVTPVMSPDDMLVVTPADVMASPNLEVITSTY